MGKVIPFRKSISPFGKVVPFQASEPRKDHIGRAGAIFEAAYAAGCKPQWHDGIFGWAWHCSCEDNRHGCDQQCSMITFRSLRKGNL